VTIPFAKCKLLAGTFLLGLHTTAVAQFDPQITDEFGFGTQGVVDGCPAAWHVDVWGIAPLYYQWFRDGVPIPGETSEWLVIWNPTVDDFGTTYYVVVNNAYGSAQSSVGRLETWNDFTPPNLIGAEPGGQPDEVELSFYVGDCGTRPLDPVTASDKSNYAIIGLQVLSAELRPSGTNVLLKTSHERPHTGYRVVVNNVQDILGNVISSQNTAAFESPFSRGVFHRRFPPQ